MVGEYRETDVRVNIWYLLLQFFVSGIHKTRMDSTFSKIIHVWISIRSTRGAYLWFTGLCMFKGKKGGKE